VIQLYHVKKKYPGDPPVLDDITLRIDKGEFIWLTGPSGA
jgi:cell division transport system ATP-binding protein